MFFCYKGSQIFYDVIGQGMPTVFLCGWGYDHTILKPLARGVDGKKVFIDFPIFGKSDALMEDWTLLDYEKLVKGILDNENIQKCNFVGHSFGGKVAICLAGKYNICRRLVLVASAGVKPKKSLGTRLKILRFKLAKKFGGNLEKFGSLDYQALPPSAKKTFTNIVNTHIENFASSICCQTLILSGKQDKDTPLFMQKKLNRLIHGSKLVVVDAGHYVWVDCPSVLNTMQNFLNDKEGL